MKRIISLLICTVLFISSFVAFGLNGNIKNKKTVQHIPISGTKVSILKPEGFSVNSITPQLVNHAGCKIAIREMGASFSILASVQTEEQYKLIPVADLLERKELKFNGYEAILLTVERKMPNTKLYEYSLIFGDNSFTVMVVGSMPIDKKDKYSKIIKEAILSTKYNK